MSIKYNSLEDLGKLAKEKGLKISDLVLEEQSKALERTKEDLLNDMLSRYIVMKEGKEEGLKKDIKSYSGLTGGGAYKLYENALYGDVNFLGETFTKALSYAMAVSEYNACMGKIVAAPTAGSCGIMPGVLLSYQEKYNCSDLDIAKAMFTASAVGMVIANVFCVSGAGGGCQAECGSASAMAAAAIVELSGGSVDQCLDAVAITIKCILGLVCDPVAGLVEVPCVKRNASGTATAYMAAQLAMANVSSVIPVDETILAMKRVGEDMSSTLKETAEGGLAVTPTGNCIRCKIFPKSI